MSTVLFHVVLLAMWFAQPYSYRADWARPEHVVENSCLCAIAEHLPLRSGYGLAADDAASWEPQQAEAQPRR